MENGYFKTIDLMMINLIVIHILPGVKMMKIFFFWLFFGHALTHVKQNKL
jgi:hypothetical protein